MWGFHLGRPFRINMEGATVSKPSPGADTPRQWMSYVSARNSDQQIVLTDQTKELHGQRVMLAEIMAPVAYIL